MKTFQPFEKRGALIGAIIYGAALSRLIPHAPNFTPIGAIALFGGAHFRNPVRAIAIVFAAMFLSDLVIGTDPTSFSVYVALALTVVIGNYFRCGESVSKGVVSCVAASLVFFIITNFAVWLVSDLYPRTGAGLVECFLLAVPFFWNTLTSDLLYFSLLSLIFAAGREVLISHRFA